MSQGKVIILQGASSAGKSTLAMALQRTLEECWWHLQADTITAMTPDMMGGESADPAKPHPSWNPDIRLERWLGAYFGCVSAIARAGNCVIADGGWLETAWLLQWIEALDGIETLVVGVYCPPEEAERREIARGDRKLGYSRSQWERVHVHAPYDVAVDTSLLSPEEAAQVIQAALSAPPVPSFFARIRTQYPFP